MSMRSIHYRHPEKGAPVCGKPYESFHDAYYANVTCKPCLAWLWDYAYRMYHWLEDRRPAGGFTRKR